MLSRFLATVTIIGLYLVAGTTTFLLYVDIARAPLILEHFTRSDDKTPAELPTATLTFVGDIMLAREVEKSIIANGVDWPFSAISDTWKTSDLVIGNFESTIRDTYRDEGSVLAFDVQPAHIAGLKNAGFTHLSLANNHGDDFGADITAYTRSVIADLGITPFGDPVTSENFVARAEPNGIPVSLIGFHAFIESPTSVLDAIRAEHDAGRFVIAFPHWGNEYQITPSAAQTDAAQMFIDAGADLIVGAHPHVIEPITSVNGTAVAYSLGNFIFDQDWSTATQEGLLLTVTITDDTVTIVPTPVTVTNRQPTVMTGARVQEILNAIGAPNGSVTFSRE